MMSRLRFKPLPDVTINLPAACPALSRPCSGLPERPAEGVATRHSDGGVAADELARGKNRAGLPGGTGNASTD